MSNKKKRKDSKKFINIIGFGCILIGLDLNAQPMSEPFSTADYFGQSNYAYSPLPEICTGVDTRPQGGHCLTTSEPGSYAGGIHKFVDKIAKLQQGCSEPNNLGQCLSIAIPDKTAFAKRTVTDKNGTQLNLPDTDYYSLEIGEYNQVMHSDLATDSAGNPSPTRLHGYRQLATGANSGIYSAYQYFSPVILAAKGRPTRLKFRNSKQNEIPLPVDQAYWGAGKITYNGTATTPKTAVIASTKRSNLHLHGGDNPWISDGTPHQWTVPANDTSGGTGIGYQKGVSFQDAPDMITNSYLLTTGACGASAGSEAECFTQSLADGMGANYYPNGQTSRTEWYHDHSFGITRLNVYMGEAAGYLLADKQTEDGLKGMNLPGWLSVDTDVNNNVLGVNAQASDLLHLIPLVIQDRTFVPDNGETGGQLAAQDPTWPATVNANDPTNFTGPKKYWLKSGGASKDGWGFGSLWLPHVYMTNQLPFSVPVPGTNSSTTINDPGRWDYAPWMSLALQFNNNPVPCTSTAYNLQMECPPFANPTAVPESFMDTALVNGTLYPAIDVKASAYRFKMLNGSDDRMYNLSFYIAATQDIQVNVVDNNDGFSGFGAIVGATVSQPGGALTGLRIIDPGTSYKPSPSVSLTNDTGTTGSGATAYLIANASGVVKKVVPKIGGSGYKVGDKVKNSTDTYNVEQVDLSGAITEFSIVTAAIPSAINTVAVNLTYGLEPADWTSIVTARSLQKAVVYPAVNDAGAIIDFYIDNPGSGYIAGGTSCENIDPSLVALCTEVKQIIPQMYSNTTTPQLCSGSQSLLQYTDDLGLVHVPDMSFGRTGMPSGCWPDTWANDGAAHGALVADPMMAGPPIYQLGNEGGLLPQGVILPATSTTYNYNRKTSTLLGASGAHSLVLAPAQRADTVVDFHAFKPSSGKVTVLVLYNDFPAPSPLYDTRYDMYTGDPDQSGSAGAPTTLPGFGPNTRTLTQVRISDSSDNTEVDVARFTSTSTGIPALYAATQAPPIISEPDYPNGYSPTPNVGTYASYSLPNQDSGMIGSIGLTNGGSYAEPPTVTIDAPPVGGTQATALANLVASEVPSVILTNVGSGYTSEPLVQFSGGGGTGAKYKAALVGTALTSSVLNPTGNTGYPTGLTTINTIQDGATSYPCNGVGRCASVDYGVASISVTPGFAGLYNTVPALTITGGTGAAATATLAATGSVTSATPPRGATAVCPTNTSSPQVLTIRAGNVNSARGSATIRNGIITAVSITNGGTGYPTTGLSASIPRCNANLNLTFTVARAISSVTVTAKGRGYKNAITVTPSAVTAPQVAARLTATATGYVSAINSANIKNAIGTNSTSNTLTLPGSIIPTTNATVTVAHIASTIASPLTKISGGSGYSSTPTISFVGGAGSGAIAVAHMPTRMIQSFTMVNQGKGYTTLPNVTLTPNVVTDQYNLNDGGGAAYAIFGPTLIDFKGIVEGFDPIWGKLSVELADSIPVPGNAPVNNPLLVAPLPLGYVDPQSEMVVDGGVADWRMDHIGVDSHAVHFHLFNVQLVNYVDPAGQIYMPDANQLGWVETLTTQPLTSAFLGIRTKQVDIPWEIPNSIRAIDPTTNVGTENGPVGCVNNPFALQPILGPNCVPFTQTDPTGNPVNITDAHVNFGAEYVYHCHLLSHEENDMMRPISFIVAPKIAPVLSRANNTTPNLTITDKSFSETSFIIQRTTNGRTWTRYATVATGTGTTTGSGVGGSTTLVNAARGTGNNAANTKYRAYAVNEVGCIPNVPALANGSQPTGTVPVCSDITTGWPSNAAYSPVSNVVQ